MLYVLNDLLERAEKQRGQVAGSYDRKKRIIGQSLYGVDVMDWACHVAELRLWLSLIVDAEFTKEQLVIREEPLLPHFSFKVRCGDSLVQEVGGIDMAHRRGVMELSQNMKRRLRDLKIEKSKFYNSDKTGKFKYPEALEQQEVLVFRELLQDRGKALHNQAKDLMRIQAEKRAHRQYSLTGQLEGPAEQFTLEREKREQQITALKAEQKSLESLHDNLRDKTTVPFVWDIAFAEIFSGYNHGFDVVIGNPPYVERHKIRDPKGSFEPTLSERKAYMQKLAKSVYSSFPHYFGVSRSGRVAHRISLMSDLYLYFYFHGLSLLNDKGSFCFITSNSWLDVGYGKDLQEFLLKRCHTQLVIDNKAKRSFKEARVNTVITLFGPPVDPKVSDEVSLDKTARFVMFYVPFEEILHPVVFEEIQEAKQKTTVPEYRIFPKKQSELLIDGCKTPDEDKENIGQSQMQIPYAKIAKYKYIGNKWGGKYLRAPDILFDLQEKHGDKLRQFNTISDIRIGVMTGANEFFFLTENAAKKHNIETKFLVPVIKSPRDLKRIEVYAEDCPYLLFYCTEDLSSLSDTFALKYIRYGERQGYSKRPFFKNRSAWWNCGNRSFPPFACNYFVNDVMRFYISKDSILFSDNFHEIHYSGPTASFVVASNSTITQLFLNVYGRTNFGEGVLKVQTRDLGNMWTIDPLLLPETEACQQLSRLKSINELALNGESRKKFDNMVFSALGLTQGEQDAIYEAVIDSVESRLKKAASLE